MKTGVESMRWIIAALVLIASGIAFIVYVALPLPGAKLGGGFFLAIGVMNALFYTNRPGDIFTSAVKLALCCEVLGTQRRRRNPALVPWDRDYFRSGGMHFAC